jgi:hypothetical protein
MPFMPGAQNGTEALEISAAQNGCFHWSKNLMSKTSLFNFKHMLHIPIKYWSSG